MSITEILEELPKLRTEDRNAILLRIEEIEGADSPELLAAIDEAEACPIESYVPIEEVRLMVKQWAHTKLS